MVDVGFALREGYMTTLKDNVIINSQVVPIVDQKLESDIATAEIYVLFVDQIEDEGNPNKTHLINEPVVRMVIVNRRKSTGNSEVVEDVANQILTLLFPDRTTWNVPLSYPLRLTYARYLGGRYDPMVQTSDGFAIKKTLTFKNRITQ